MNSGKKYSVVVQATYYVKLYIYQKLLSAMNMEDGFEAQSDRDSNQALIPPMSCIMLVETFVPISLNFSMCKVDLLPIL